MAKNIEVTGVKVRLQAGTDRTYYASWNKLSGSKTVTVNKKKQKKTYDSLTDNYSYEWDYYTGGKWFEGSTGTVENVSGKPVNCTYSAPDNAEKVRFKVKPIAKTYTDKKKKEHSRYSSSWSKWVPVDTEAASTYTPETPSNINVELTAQKITVTLDTYDTNTSQIEFEILSNDNQKITVPKIGVVNNRVKYVQDNLATGHGYRVRAKAWNGSHSSDWSQYTNEEWTPPNAPGKPIIVGLTSTSVEVSWAASDGAETYTIEYTTNEDYFIKNRDAVQTKEGIESTVQHITDLSGDIWYFRVRSVNSHGNSEWSAVEHSAIGKRPNAPTTWSSTTTAYVGRDVYLYWTHNAADSARETTANLKLIINGAADPEIIPIPNETQPEDDTGTYSYVLNTDRFEAGASIEWCVQTKGAVEEYSEWSITRTIDIYKAPSLNMTIGSGNRWLWDPFNFDLDDIYTAQGDLIPWTGEPPVVTSLPLFIQLIAEPFTQTPVVYYISIVSLADYEDVDSAGEPIFIRTGQEVFNKIYNRQRNTLTIAIGPDELNLQDGISYKIVATVSMDSGLEASTSIEEFIVDWQSIDYYFDADFTYDEATTSIYIQPACYYVKPDDEETDGEYVEDVLLTVYRQNFDGEFIEVAAGLPNEAGLSVVDPHPPLNYGRYRIVAKSLKTGEIDFADLETEPIEESAIIIQWNERSNTFNNDTTEDETEADEPYSGMMLKLPYNVDVTDSNEIDTEFVEYIGRKHPVSYYGTHVRQKSSWKSTIPSDDIETINLLRKLSVWMGDAYVREPNGTGYWAQVKVSFSIEHCSVTIPVNLELTRVEGGL